MRRWRWSRCDNVVRAERADIPGPDAPSSRVLFLSAGSVFSGHFEDDDELSPHGGISHRAYLSFLEWGAHAPSRAFGCAPQPKPRAPSRVETSAVARPRG